MVTVHEAPDTDGPAAGGGPRRRVVYAKGAPDRLMPLCCGQVGAGRGRGRGREGGGVGSRRQLKGRGLPWHGPGLSPPPHPLSLRPRLPSTRQVSGDLSSTAPMVEAFWRRAQAAMAAEGLRVLLIAV